MKRRIGTSKRTKSRRVEEVIKYFGNTNEICEITVPQKDAQVLTSASLTTNESDLTDCILSESLCSPPTNSFPCEANEETLTYSSVFMAPKTNVHRINCELRSTQTSTLDDKQTSLREDLRIWSLECAVANSTTDSLLRILKNHGIKELPGSARTLKGTHRTISIRAMGKGRFWYHGICTFLEILESEGVSLPPRLTLCLNSDGVSLFGSSKAGLWPLLGTFKEMRNLKPFVIGLYFDEMGEKPDDVHEYLSEFIEEFSYLLLFGYKETSFDFGDFPLDAPALAFIKDTKAHNAKKSCHKCNVTGRSILNRTCYLQVNNLILRTDLSFRSHEDPAHHQSSKNSPMEALPIDMINTFNLDYLHVCLLGVIKKKLKILTKKTKRIHYLLRIKLNKTNSVRIQKVTKNARKSQPCEIPRSIRSLDYITNMKGTEFLTFMLYHGIVALMDNVHPDIFKNYLTFHIALTICLADEHKHLLPISQMCFEMFVVDFKKLYGIHLASYNVHNLLHLVAEVQRCGPLDNYSTFPYENMLGYLKKLPKSGYKSFEQGILRYEESIHHNVRSYKEAESNKSNHPQFNSNQQYDEVIVREFKLRTNDRDCWFLTHSLEVVMLISITSDNKLKGQRIKSLRDFYTTPLRSSFLKIFEAECDFEPICIYKVEDVKAKMFGIKRNESSSIFFPLLHTFHSN